MKTRKLIIATAFFSVNFLLCQYVTEIPELVSKKSLEIETDFAYEDYKKVQQFYYPAFLLKYGITENLEIHFQTSQSHSQSNDYTFSGISPFAIGFKTKIYNGNSILPAISLFSNVGLHKTGSKIYQTTYLNPSIYLLFNQIINPKILLQYNIGTEWDGETKEQITNYSFALLKKIKQNNSLFIEYFGYTKRNQTSNHHFDAGINYLISKNLTFENSIGIGFTENSLQYFTNFKINYTINFIKNTD